VISGRTRRRGQPLMFLGVVLLGWMGLRVALWQQPFTLPGDFEQLPGDTVAGRGTAGPGPAVSSDTGIEAAPANEPSGDDADRAADGLDRPLPGLLPAPLPARDLSSLDLPGGARTASSSRSGGEAQSSAAAPSPGRMAVGHALLAMRGLSQTELPPTFAAYLGFAGQRELAGGRSLQTDTPDIGAREAGAREAARQPLGLAAAPASVQRRWSANGWLLLRGDDGARSLVAGQPSYGRSQAGAVLRYRLAPSSRHQPQAYARTSSALRSPRDAEIAGGLSARPLAGVPVRLAAELRVADTQAGTELRPAAFAVTEFPPLDLPLGARGEAYLQGGYVGGSFATPFIDGQVRVSRHVAQIGGASLSTGVGAWGGAQEGASRLDIGPSAALAFRLGELNSRLALDYRVRVAGDAEPRSGPALTLSAGF